MSGEPSEVSLTFDVAAPPETVWAMIARFDEVASWHPFLASSKLVSGSVAGVNAIREVVTADGTPVREQLELWDAARRTIGYRMLTFPLPATEQHNRIVVEAADHGGTLITLSARYTPDGEDHRAEVADINRAAFTAAAQGLGRAVGGAVTLAA